MKAIEEVCIAHDETCTSMKWGCRGFCGGHYSRWKKGELPESIKPNPKSTTAKSIRKCSHPSCERMQVKTHRSSSIWCYPHRHRHERGLDMDAPVRPEGWKGRRARNARVNTNPGGWGEWKVNGAGYLHRHRKNLVTGKVEGQLQHRHFVEESIGRPLLPKESVHHKNGVRNDNRLENLELWSGSHPSGQRISDKVEWATELLKTYAPERLKDAVE